MRIGNKEFLTSGHTYVMGILNVTPDSFSDGGEHNDLDKALFHTERMIKEGADIVDVGGESTRPGHIRISDYEEIERITPIIEKIKQNFDIPISVDTYKAAVARAAIQSGADLINDIWGLQKENMAELIAEYDIPCCLMHNREEQISESESLLKEVSDDMRKILSIAGNAGINNDRIILDPGIGFAKNTTQNLKVLNCDNFMMPKGYPILLGTSRKSVIGNTLQLPVSERVEGTLVTTVLAVQQEAMFVRVHDVKENIRCIKMMEAIRNS